MSQALRRRLEHLEQNTAPPQKGYWLQRLSCFYGEDAPPIWVASDIRLGLNHFYRLEGVNADQRTHEGISHDK